MENEGLTTGRAALGAHFRARIGALLDEWRALIAADPKLTVSDTLPRVQLEDHLPSWLDAFAGVLAHEPQAVREEIEDAKAHGLQRWQQGYDLHDVTREWGCLHRCLVAEVERFAAAHPEQPAELLTEARLKLAEQISDAMSKSAEKYFHLDRVEAAGSVLDLERALADVRDLEKQRADLWQQAAHDLRGNLGVVSNVAHGLNLQDLPAERRQDFLGLLRNNVTALHHLLDDVTALARLQAGQEQRGLSAFDGAELLRRIVDDVRPMAESRRLHLKVDGPATLPVRGDAVKVRRIAQNLLLNALKYTREGGVTVAWGEGAGGDHGRWEFSVADTGPGFHAGPGAPIVNALNPDKAADPGAIAEMPDARVAAASDDDQRPISQAQGEGIGLAIVKRLCDLLDASVEIETAAGQGTTVRVFLPSRYGE